MDSANHIIWYSTSDQSCVLDEKFHQIAATSLVCSSILLYNNDMRQKLTIPIGLVILLAIILLIGASPLSANVMMYPMADSNDGTCSEAPTIPLCCISASYLVSHYDTVNLNLPVGKFIPDDNNNCSISHWTSSENPTTFSKDKPPNTGPDLDTSQIYKAYYYCRNSLTPEEPPLS
jgi:hypothetical protein